jgi:intracellular septation protein
MQLLSDFLPILIFAAAYWARDIYVATAALMIAMAAQVTYQWIRHRKVNKMLLASSLLVAVFGTMTLILRNPLFIKWKVTVVYWLFAAAFFGSQFFGKKTLIEHALGQTLKLDAGFWRQLNVVWALAFFVVGAVNLYVMYNFSEAVWVSYKVVGATALLIVTLAGQGVWIYLRAPEAFADPEEKPHNAGEKRETSGDGP